MVDLSELRGGDLWDQKIRRQIRECALFVPIVSANTQARPEGYFRREWKMAVDRTQDMSESRAFIVPVLIDGIAESAADVPEHFLKAHFALEPANTDILALTMILLRNLGRLEQAVAVGRYLAAHDPLNNNSHVLLGGACIRTGRYDEAAALRRGIQLAPQRNEIQASLADALLLSGKAQVTSNLHGLTHLRFDGCGLLMPIMSFKLIC